MASDQSPKAARRCAHCSTVADPEAMFCPSCGASLSWGDDSIQVSGTNADEVLRVAKALVEQRAERSKLASPWVSGSFYLCCVVVIVAVVLIAGKILSFLALPIVIVASILLVMIVGAFQQRQDDRLSEKSFLQLMLATLKSLPLVVKRQNSPNSSK
jgi:hypothetical protein